MNIVNVGFCVNICNLVNQQHLQKIKNTIINKESSFALIVLTRRTTTYLLYKFKNAN